MEYQRRIKYFYIIVERCYQQRALVFHTFQQKTRFVNVVAILLDCLLVRIIEIDKRRTIKTLCIMTLHQRIVWHVALMTYAYQCKWLFRVKSRFVYLVTLLHICRNAEISHTYIARKVSPSHFFKRISLFCKRDDWKAMTSKTFLNTFYEICK